MSTGNEDVVADLMTLSALLPSLKHNSTKEILEKLNSFKKNTKEQTIRLEKKLYVGNLPPGISKDKFLDGINQALDHMKLNQGISGDSAIDAWISPDGKFFLV